MSALQVTCTLASDARRARTRDGRSVLMLDLRLPHHAQGKPIKASAVRDYGASAAADIACATAARSLRRGERVTLHVAGIGWRRGTAVLDGIELIDPGAPAWTLRHHD